MSMHNVCWKIAVKLVVRVSDVRSVIAINDVESVIYLLFVLCWQVQRLYGKYLRAESFRKALIYQKKYLLLLIGGFRDCEEETLALIARMGAQPSLDVLAHQHLSPLSKFRSAARVIVAISRFFTCAIQCAAKKVSPKVVCHFLSNHLEFLREILHVYYLFIYT